MSLLTRPSARKLLVHWLVLVSLTLGQVAMSATLALGQARQSQSNAELQNQTKAQTKVPVCTSTGVIYVSWAQISQSGDDQPTPLTTTHAGHCVWCTVAPHQLRLDLQRDASVEVSAADVASYPQLNVLAVSTFTGNPNAPPRAPPFV